MELASAYDESTNSFLKTNFGASEAWLGGYRDDVSNETSWRWADKKWGSKTWRFTNWAPGEPKNQEALVTNYKKAGQWDDQEKDSLHSFICQMSKTGFLFLKKKILHGFN